VGLGVVDQEVQEVYIVASVRAVRAQLDVLAWLIESRTMPMPVQGDLIRSGQHVSVQILKHNK
jgi:hypothetical protein